MNKSFRQLLALPIIGCILVSFVGCTHGTVDPAKTAMFTTFTRDLLKGRVDGANIDIAMKAALTPTEVAHIQARFAQDGTFIGLRFLGDDKIEVFRRYHYAGQFSVHTVPLIFVLDGNGKIAGFFNQ